MGEIYRARDPRLQRDVAIKVLPPEAAADRDRLRRFTAEARAASALNHPNILTVHEIGEAECGPYLVTELVEGNTLRELVAAQPLGVLRALDVAIQAAEGIAKAHEAGIIHRDLKPENLMLSRDGFVKILDFGLVKLLRPEEASADEQSATASGMIVGTVGYISPEQLAGRAADARSDVFSLGVVLYEMLSGANPFRGETPAQTISAILRDHPPPLTAVVANAPGELARVTTRALAKRPEERHETARQFAAELRQIRTRLESKAVTTAPGTAQQTALEKPRTERRWLVAWLSLLVLVGGFLGYRYFSSNDREIDSIAVLPFVNASGNPELEYLSDGISESLIYNLSQLPQMKVIARSSTFRYKGKEADPQAVASALGVDVVLTGRVQQRGESLVINAELTDARNMTQLWGEHYNRRASDLLAVQADISREISMRLRPRLGREERQRVAKNYTTENESYRLYLKGRYFWNRRTQEGYEQAIESFQQATERDPNYALAYVGLADAQAFLRVRGQSGQEAYQQAKTTVERALEIDDTLGEAHATLAMLRQNADWDWPGAEEQYQRATELSPNYATAHHWYGELLIQLGRVEEGLVLQKRALEIDPLSLAISSDLGLSYYYARQYDRALEQLQKTLALDPLFFRTYFYLARIYEQLRQYDKAIAEYQKGLLRRGENPERVEPITAALSAALAGSGERGYWQKRLEVKRQHPQWHSEWECDLAGVLARLGESERALAELEKAYQEGLFDLLFLRVSPEFDGLRGDPRFQDLVRRTGLPR
jgi:serine/threonine-protein kinase